MLFRKLRCIELSWPPWKSSLSQFANTFETVPNLFSANVLELKRRRTTIHSIRQRHVHPEHPGYEHTLGESASRSLTLLKVTQDYVKQRGSKCRHLHKDNEMLRPVSRHYVGEFQQRIEPQTISARKWRPALAATSKWRKEA